MNFQATVCEQKGAQEASVVNLLEAFGASEQKAEDDVFSEFLDKLSKLHCFQKVLWLLVNVVLLYLIYINQWRYLLVIVVSYRFVKTTLPLFYLEVNMTLHSYLQANSNQWYQHKTYAGYLSRALKCVTKKNQQIKDCLMFCCCLGRLE